MAEQFEDKLKAWGRAAEDDVDLRTEAGRRILAERYAARKKISVDEALAYVQSELKSRADVTRSQPRPARTKL